VTHLSKCSTLLPTRLAAAARMDSVIPAKGRTEKGVVSIRGSILYTDKAASFLTRADDDDVVLLGKLVDHVARRLFRPVSTSGSVQRPQSLPRKHPFLAKSARSCGSAVCLSSVVTSAPLAAVNASLPLSNSLTCRVAPSLDTPKWTVWCPFWFLSRSFVIWLDMLHAMSSLYYGKTVAL
jgi:hypothetical protein